MGILWLLQILGWPGQRTKKSDKYREAERFLERCSDFFQSKLSFQKKQGFTRYKTCNFHGTLAATQR
jgi:hypothetical protein